jgi:hypothetical protein
MQNDIIIGFIIFQDFFQFIFIEINALIKLGNSTIIIPKWMVIF